MPWMLSLGQGFPLLRMAICRWLDWACVCKQLDKCLRIDECRPSDRRCILVDRSFHSNIISISVRLSYTANSPLRCLMLWVPSFRLSRNTHTFATKASYMRLCVTFWNVSRLFIPMSDFCQRSVAIDEVRTDEKKTTRTHYKIKQTPQKSIRWMK